jgi:hypothetical protein
MKVRRPECDEQPCRPIVRYALANQLTILTGVIGPPSSAESGIKEDKTQRVYYAGRDWRILGTYNNVDLGRVFPMGSALLRRLAIVPIPPVPAEYMPELLKQISGVSPPLIELITKLYQFHLGFLKIGPAPFLDMAKYVLDEEGEDGPTQDAVLSAPAVTLLQDAYVLYMAQQMVRIDPERREEFLKGVGAIIGAAAKDELSGY